ncbi:MAG: hypothetical protein Kapaf2KO_02880 [Candidatus Kapaibacteriales bacterium]
MNASEGMEEKTEKKELITTIEHYKPLGMQILIGDKSDLQATGFSYGDRAIAKVVEVTRDGVTWQSPASELKWRLGFVSLNSDEFYINFSKAKANTIKVVNGDGIKLHVWPDTSKYGADMPEELEAMLNQEPEFNRRFHAKTPGYQRTFIHAISGYKTSATRLKHAIRLMRNFMNMPEGKESIGDVVRGK